MRPLPPYSSHAVELFDDSIEPAALGFAMEASKAPAPRGDTLLRERTQVSDGTLHVRVVTVTLRNEGAGRSWQVGFHTLKTFAGGHPPEPDFTLQIDSTDPAAGFLRAFEARLIGMTFVAFVREFQGNDANEGARWHFHLAHDRQDELDAVRAALVIGHAR